MPESNYKKAIADALSAEYIAMIPPIYEEHVFSARFEKKVRRLINRRQKPYYPLISTAARRATCIVVAVLVFSASAMSVKAVREAVYDFIVRVFYDHTEIKSTGTPSDAYPKTIEDEYYIEDLPEGFELVDHDLNSHSIFFAYFHDDDYIFFEQNTKNSYIGNYDNEFSDQYIIEENGQNYIVFDTGDCYTFAWDNGMYIFEIDSNLNKEDILKLCKSTKIK